MQPGGESKQPMLPKQSAIQSTATHIPTTWLLPARGGAKKASSPEEFFFSSLSELPPATNPVIALIVPRIDCNSLEEGLLALMSAVKFYNETPIHEKEKAVFLADNFQNAEEMLSKTDPIEEGSYKIILLPTNQRELAELRQANPEVRHAAIRKKIEDCKGRVPLPRTFAVPMITAPKTCPACVIL